MHKSPIALFLLPIALGNCASPASPVKIDTSYNARAFAWDGLGEDPNKPRRTIKRVQVQSVEEDANRKREQVMALLRPYSAAWWVVHDEIEADYDNRLAHKLVICRGCLPASKGADLTVPAD